MNSVKSKVFTLWRCSLIGILVLTLWLFCLSRLGTWLIVADHPEKAQAIVVFSGQMPFRAMEAAQLYKEGWAPEVWLTQGRFSAEGQALDQLGIPTVPEYEFSRRVLVRLAVPARVIRVLDGRNDNTAAEVRTVQRELKRISGNRVFLVTSKYHTRRVKVLWSMLPNNRAQAIVRYTNADPFNASRWWRTAGDSMAVFREVFGLLNAWAGFPVSSER
jgi:uncharacterized SAM-binding protein YcdF (DUF218 family)